jgi:hypothetical protein
MKLKFSSKIELSKRDKEKGLVLPDEMSEDLAYLCGVLMGDGHLSIRENKSERGIKCVGHPLDEKDFYDHILQPLFKKNFNLCVKMRPLDGNTTYGFDICSKALTIFFKDIGIPVGRKSEIANIPPLIKKSKMEVPFIRGLADTDFCLTLKKRYKTVQYYPVIVGVSKSKILIDQVSDFLEKFEFRPSKDTRVCFDKRFNKNVTTYAFQLYGHDQLVKWMSIISFKSPKHLKKYELWKERKSGHSWKRIKEMKG